MRISYLSSDVCSSDLSGRRRCLARHPETIRRSVDGAVRAFRRGAGDRNRPARRLLSRRVADLRRARPSLGKQRGAIPGRIRRLIMRDAVIVSTARTPLTKAGRGSFNNTLAPTLGAHRSEEHTSELQSLMRNSYAV